MLPLHRSSRKDGEYAVAGDRDKIRQSFPPDAVETFEGQKGSISKDADMDRELLRPISWGSDNGTQIHLSHSTTRPLYGVQDPGSHQPLGGPC